MFHHWSHTHLREKAIAVFGVQTVTEFYASQFAPIFDKIADPLFVSLGSGDGTQEIEIVESLVAKGYDRFHFLGLELNPILVDAANQLARSKALGPLISFQVCDVNRGGLSPQLFDINGRSPRHEVHGFMAQHSLHHIVELEQTFDFIDQYLAEDGRFLTLDVIGRNGHMRWPEALAVVEAVWDKLPERYRYNHQHKKLYSTFVDWDCSGYGFEGIRAQDILRLMVERFTFEKFLGAGGFIDVFVDRAFGPNFDPTNDGDRLLIDCLEGINDMLVDRGIIKPTLIYASVMKKRPGVIPKVYKNRTPEFCIRRP